MMMDALLTFLFEFILVFPGAFFRWILNGCRKKYSNFLDDAPEVNVLAAIIGFGLLFLLVKFLVSLA